MASSSMAQRAQKYSEGSDVNVEMDRVVLRHSDISVERRRAGRKLDCHVST